MENKDFGDIIEMIKKTYGFYHQKYVVMTNKYTKTVSHYFTDKVIESHLNGYYALGTFAGEKVTRFISVDIDEGGKKAVRKVMDAFVEMGIPKDRIYVSTSGKKGYHVEIFFNPWLHNDKAKNLYELMIWRTGLDPHKVEFRPTNSQAIKIPLGLHAQTRNRCWYLDRETLQPIERMDYIKEIIPIMGEDVRTIIREWNKKHWNEMYAEMICNDTGRDVSIQKEIEFNLEYYEQRRLTERGTRHNVMVKIACDLRHYGANHFQIQKALKGFYYRQDPLMIETSEEDVLNDIEDIAQWAEKSVPVWKQRESAAGEPKPVVFIKNDINYILMGPTSATRRVAFLLWSYCKIFGASHISYEAIARTVGCSIATAKNAVTKLLDNRLIFRQSGGCHYQNGMLVRKANTYFIPRVKTLACPPAEDLIADSYSFTGKILPESFDSLYYGTMAGLCRPEYLAKFLTKPELEECKRRIANGAEDQDDDAGGDEGISGVCGQPGDSAGL